MQRILSVTVKWAAKNMCHPAVPCDNVTGKGKIKQYFTSHTYMYLHLSE